MSAAPDELPPPLARAVARAGFASPLDLLLHFPRRHEDWENATPVAALKSGGTVMVEGEITDSKTVPARGRQHLLVTLQDSSGDALHLRFFHVTPGLKSFLEIGRALRARGKVSFSGRQGWEMAHPKFTSSDGEKKMRSIYPAVKTLSSPRLQKLISAVLEAVQLPPILPPALETFSGSDWSLKQSLQAAHAPMADGASPLPPEHVAWQRLRFEELVAHQIVLRRRYYYRRAAAPRIQAPAERWQRFYDALPFQLTGAQARAIAAILADLSRPAPMRRLLQGDVGSGKTVVAAAACYAAIQSDCTAAFMAPTEILAEQHYRSLSALFEKLSLHCELLTGAVSPRQRLEAENRLRFGISALAVGTHVLFQESVALPRLGLAVIDEQHRFGVEQRKQFTAKGAGAHQLMMSATPIPRTLALSLYADMDVSMLDEKPAGRQPVRTLARDSSARPDIMRRTALHIRQGRRAYWVCPLIEEGGGEAARSLRDVHSAAAEWRERFPDIGAGIIHGRMKADEKNAAMKKFHSGETPLLVATTVIEVGVDVANADVMVIEHADRLGLSQLHQLRGRVGRGGQAGVCILLYQPPLSEEARQRLSVMRSTDDGFEIASQDLKIRGPGEWLGSRQSGLPSLRVARLGDVDQDLADCARQTADWMLKNDKRGCIRHIRRWLGNIR